MKKEKLEVTSRNITVEPTSDDDFLIAIGIGLIFGIPMIIQLLKFYVFNI
jgi:hypothetical protein